MGLMPLSTTEVAGTVPVQKRHGYADAINDDLAR
jgi:hypothetical protein